LNLFDRAGILEQVEHLVEEMPLRDIDAVCRDRAGGATVTARRGRAGRCARSSPESGPVRDRANGRSVEYVYRREHGRRHGDLDRDRSERRKIAAPRFSRTTQPHLLTNLKHPGAFTDRSLGQKVSRLNFLESRADSAQAVTQIQKGIVKANCPRKIVPMCLARDTCWAGHVANHLPPSML